MDKYSEINFSFWFFASFIIKVDINLRKPWSLIFIIKEEGRLVSIGKTFGFTKIHFNLVGLFKYFGGDLEERCRFVVSKKISLSVRGDSRIIFINNEGK